MSADTAVEDDDYPSSGRALFTLGVLVGAYITSYVDRQIVSLLVQPIKASLHVNNTEMGLLQGFAFAMLYSVLGIPLGRMADRYNRKSIIAGGIFLWSLMTMACGLAGSFGALFVARVGVGVGEAALAPAAFSLLADTFRPAKLVRATAIFSLGSLLGTGVSFIVGGAIIALITRVSPHAGGLEPWQLTFIAIGAPGVIVAALVLFIQEPRRRSLAPLLPLGQSVARLWTLRRPLWPYYACACLLGIMGYGMQQWLPAHLIQTFAVSPAEVGAALGPVQLACVFIGVGSGAFLTERAQNRGHPSPYLRTILIESAALILMSALVPLAPSFAASVVLYGIYICFQAAYMGSLTAGLQLLIPPLMRGLNSAIFMLCLTIVGYASGAVLIGAAADYVFHDLGRALAAIASLSAALSALVAGVAVRKALLQRVTAG